MKRILFMFIIFSKILIAVEIFNEFYVMEKVIPFLEKSSTRILNGEKMKIIKVDKKILKALDTTSTPFYFYNSNNKKSKASLGDYLISPLNLAEIYSVSKENFEK